MNLAVSIARISRRKKNAIYQFIYAFDIRCKTYFFVFVLVVYMTRTSEIFTHARHAQKFLARFMLYVTTKCTSIPFSDAYRVLSTNDLRLTWRVFTHNSPTDYFLPFQTKIAKRRNARYHARHKWCISRCILSEISSLWNDRIIVVHII